ncbi:hypothetical protein MPH_10442 [Macrophomina phaseolina MS6]|uniref:Uncharacterized protein n=1 Tax=Macrophomina phaseolina (strain MS6) TaxID=1126212 RepID=K2S6D5_MACPH|nr:hypothetical protein MPH_10442 [Macrophomina phaseolina MS6]
MSHYTARSPLGLALPAAATLCKAFLFYAIHALSDRATVSHYREVTTEASYRSFLKSDLLPMRKLDYHLSDIAGYLFHTAAYHRGLNKNTPTPLL